MKRRWILVGAVALLLAGGLALARDQSDSEARWARVAIRDLVIDVVVEGELLAASSATIGPPAASESRDFKISFLAPEGSEVTPGDPVLRFDVSQLQRRLEQRKAERDAAEKELEKASTDFAIQRRDKELQRAEAEARLRRADLKLTVPEHLTSSTELGQARIDKHLAELDVVGQNRGLENLGRRSEAELEALRQTRNRRALQVHNLERQIEMMTVIAPKEGTVIYLNHRGQKMKVGDSVWRGQKVLQIPDLTTMRAGGQVDEADAGRVSVGQPVTLRLDSHPDQVYRGTVASIRRAVQRKSRANPEKVVRLEIALDETDTVRMRPGMRYRGNIEVDRLKELLVVPEDAVYTESSGLGVYVRTWQGRRLERPTFGPRNRDYFSVAEGLQEGDWVLRRPTGGGAT